MYDLPFEVMNKFKIVYVRDGTIIMELFTLKYLVILVTTNN